MVSVIVSPEEIYVHPVQEYSGDLAQLERELDMMVEGDQVARGVEVAVGSIWAVHQKAWYRVEVISVSSGHVNLRSIDYGHVLLDVDASHLNRLPLVLPPSFLALLSGVTWPWSSQCRRRPGISLQSRS